MTISREKHGDDKGGPNGSPPYEYVARGVRAAIAVNVLTYNLTRVMDITGVQPTVAGDESSASRQEIDRNDVRHVVDCGKVEARGTGKHGGDSERTSLAGINVELLDELA